jgi:hypothetical protein
VVANLVHIGVELEAIYHGVHIDFGELRVRHSASEVHGDWHSVVRQPDAKI